MKENVDNLVDRLDNFSIHLSDSQIQQFLNYYELLIETNKVMNLTAITEFEQVVEKHFVDSLSIVRVLSTEKPLRILDLGTGAGFPGIPIKIAYPELSVTLVDSLQKRVTFLEYVIRELGLRKISAIHARAEELARDHGYREQYDVCVSRAVANLSTLSEYCLPFVRIGGVFVAYKSGKVEEECKQAERAMDILGGKLGKMDHFQIGENDRTLLVIEKKKASPGKYPRKAGTPSKNPIL